MYMTGVVKMKCGSVGDLLTQSYVLSDRVTWKKWSSIVVWPCLSEKHHTRTVTFTDCQDRCISQFKSEVFEKTTIIMIKGEEFQESIQVGKWKNFLLKLISFFSFMLFYKTAINVLCLWNSTYIFCRKLIFNLMFWHH